MSVMPTVIQMTDIQAAMAAGKARKLFVSQWGPVKLPNGNVADFLTTPVVLTIAGAANQQVLTIGGSARPYVIKAGSFLTYGSKYVQIAADLTENATSVNATENLSEAIPAATPGKYEPVIEVPRASALPTVARQIQTATEQFFGNTPNINFKVGETLGQIEIQVGGSRKHPVWVSLNRCNEKFGLDAMIYFLGQNATDGSWDKGVAMVAGGNEAGGIQEAGKWAWSLTPTQLEMVA